MNYWQTNLQFLSQQRNPWAHHLAARLAEAGQGPDLGMRSRSGATLPGVVVGGQTRSLVSTFDSVREAQRWAEGEGTIAVLGGAGRDAALALFSVGARLVLWVEPRLDVWRSLMTWEDWTAIPGNWLPVLTAEDLGSALTRRYHPLWDGGFRTLEWRSAVAGCEELWDGHRQAAAQALEAAAADTSTQARFAERWYRNMLINLRRLEPGAVEPVTGARVVVAGAGPGLDDALDDPANHRWLEGRAAHGGRVFSTDTALPALLGRGVVPDVVFSLDGQLPTYHHYVSARPPGVPVIADLASLPLLGRLGMPVVRYLTGHPLSTVIRRHFPELPLLTGSGGHVSGLAYRAAKALGAGTVDAWGVDFVYRDGQTYAKATYVYDLAARGSQRRSPMESILSASCYGAHGLERSHVQGRALDTTPRLRDYRREWPPQDASPVKLAHDGAGSRWKAFASDWRRRLETLPLPPPGTNMQLFVLTLAEDVRQDWLALWPLALALFRQGEPSLRALVDRALDHLQD